MRTRLPTHAWREPVDTPVLAETVTLACFEHLHGRCTGRTAPNRTQRAFGHRPRACACRCHAPAVAGDQLSLYELAS